MISQNNRDKNSKGLITLRFIVRERFRIQRERGTDMSGYNLDEIRDYLAFLETKILQNLLNRDPNRCKAF